MLTFLKCCMEYYMTKLKNAKNVAASVRRAESQWEPGISPLDQSGARQCLKQQWEAAGGTSCRGTKKIQSPEITRNQISTLVC